MRWRLALGLVIGLAVLGCGQPATPVALRAPIDWNYGVPMPTARYALSLAYTGGTIHALGGFDGRYLGTHEAYSLAKKSWSTRAPMSVPRENLAVAVLEGQLYAVGGDVGERGKDFHVFATNEVYDPDRDVWTTRAAMPTPRRLLGLVAANGKLYALGGENGEQRLLSLVEEYDPATNAWRSRAPAPVAGGLAFALADRIYLLEAGPAGNQTYAYDPVADTWIRRADSPRGLWPTPGTVLDERILVGFSNDVHVYDPRLDAWYPGSAQLQSADSPGITAADGRIYSLGGWLFPTMQVGTVTFPADTRVQETLPAEPSPVLSALATYGPDAALALGALVVLALLARFVLPMVLAHRPRPCPVCGTRCGAGRQCPTCAAAQREAFLSRVQHLEEEIGAAPTDTAR